MLPSFKTDDVLYFKQKLKNMDTQTISEAYRKKWTNPTIGGFYHLNEPNYQMLQQKSRVGHGVKMNLTSKNVYESPHIKGMKKNLELTDTMNSENWNDYQPPQFKKMEKDYDLSQNINFKNWIAYKPPHMK